MPRPSFSAAAAHAAAAQAEFNEKKWVWVPDEREGYLAGWVTKEDDEQGDVVIAANSEVRCSALGRCDADGVVEGAEGVARRAEQDEPAQV